MAKCLKWDFLNRQPSQQFDNKVYFWRLYGMSNMGGMIHRLSNDRRIKCNVSILLKFIMRLCK